MPLIIGSTTFKAAATATAASKALPPFWSTSSPARVASGWAELTMPLVPRAGRVGVFLVAGPSTGSGSDSAARAGAVVFSPVEPSEAAVSCVDEVFPTVLASRRALSFRALDGAPQDHSTPTSNATRRILLKTHLREPRPSSPREFKPLLGKGVGIGALCLLYGTTP
jgi:hypothetical protein